jgi:hypothetical protein
MVDAARLAEEDADLLAEAILQLLEGVPEGWMAAADALDNHDRALLAR